MWYYYIQFKHFIIIMFLFFRLGSTLVQLRQKMKMNRLPLLLLKSV